MIANAGQGRRGAWRSLTFQLLAIVVFPLIVLILGVTYISTTLHQNAMRQLVGDRDERAARMAATSIEDQLQHRANAVRLLASQLPEASAGKAEDYFKNVELLSSDFDLGIAILERDGSTKAIRGVDSLGEEPTALIQQKLAALKVDPGLGVYVSSGKTSSERSKGYLVVAASSPDGQRVVAGAFSSGSLVERIFANTFALNNDTSVVVISPSKEIIFQKGFDSQAETVEQHVGVAEALSGKHGTTYIDVAGSEHVVAYSPVEALDWALVIEEPWEKVASPILEITHMAPLILVPVLLLALLAVFFGVRQIVQPLQTLAVQSGQLGWGDYAAIETPVGGIAEIRLLQQELIRMAHKVRAAQQSLHSFIGAITSGQEEERRRLARELHDDTIQSLIALKQRVQLVEMDWEGHAVSNALSELEQVAEQSIENLRRMISALRPIYLEDLGLVAAVEMLVNETGETLKSGVGFSRKGTERRLEDSIELALYRIVQEALTNITRHSGASHAEVQVEFVPEEVRIWIKDNGKGFAVPKTPAEFAPAGHFGLLGMFERADLIGAEIEIQSGAGKGTRLIIRAPYDLLEAKRKSSQAARDAAEFSLSGAD